MIEEIFRSAFVRCRMAASHLGIILCRFALHLRSRGHSMRCVQAYSQIAEHFAGWLARRRLSGSQIDSEAVGRFLREHLPRCHCPRPAPVHIKNCRAALHRLLAFLGDSAPSGGSRVVCHPLMVPLLSNYERHLRDMAGVTASTCAYRVRYAREFLRTRLTKTGLRLGAIPTADLRRYVQRRAAALKPASLRVLAGALRDFLRFLHLTGRGGEQCAAAVPTPAPWPRSRLPRTLSKTEVRALLAGFNRTTATGRRDYAMALCLTQLGLRVSEVAALSLEDVEWQRDTLRLRQTKQRRDRLLPMPAAVKGAIIGYLRHGRPGTASRALFVRHRAPLGDALCVHHVRGAMRRAFIRSGLDAMRVHLLRHTFATGLHQKRGGLKAIADVLGHQCLDTTARYARVNLRELREAALPWPGT